MIGLLKRYTKWLHTQWPAGIVEKFPVTSENGITTVPGVRIVGDLTGIPLLKFSSHTGAGAVRAILQEPDFRRAGTDADVLDLAIVGGEWLGFPPPSKRQRRGFGMRSSNQRRPSPRS